MFIGRFCAELSNGEEITELYPDESEKCGYMGWTRLNEYCERISVHIVGMKMIIKDLEHKAPDKAEKYFVNMRCENTIGVEKQIARGLGFKKDKQWFIIWLDEEGQVIEMEIKKA